MSGGYVFPVASYIVIYQTNKEVFTIGFEIGWQSHHAKKIANYLNTKHHEYVIKNSDIFNILNNYKNLYDEPIGDPAILPTAFLSKETKKSVKVVHSADGGDELFAGYDKYRKIINRNKKSKIIPSFLRNIIKDNRLEQGLLFEKKYFKKIYKYFKNENIIDWFIDDSLHIVILNSRIYWNIQNYSKFSTKCTK